MDGVLRFSGQKVNGFYIVITGTWITDNRLSLRYFQLGASTHLAIEAEFPPNPATVAVQIRDATN